MMGLGILGGTAPVRRPVLAAEAGLFTLTGEAAGFHLARTLAVGVGSFSLTGFAAAFTAGRQLTAGAGSFTLTGEAVTFTQIGPPSYANSGGTGNRSSLITVTTDITMLGSGGIAVLVDGSQADSAFFTSGQSSRTIKFDFGASTYKVISEFKWYQDSGTGHGTWAIEASNDDSNWVPISSSFSLATGATTTVAVNWNANKAYRYYRLKQLSGTLSSSPFIREIEFKIADGPAAETNNAAVPSYLNTGGMGDRTASITVSTTATLGGGTIDNLVDGAVAANTTDSCWFNAGQSTRSVTFDFGSAKTVTGVAWIQDIASTQGSWKLQGSNDNSSYTDLGSAFALGAQIRTVSNDAAANTTAYRYYRLLQTSGSTASAPWLEEVWFEVAA